MPNATQQERVTLSPRLTDTIPGYLHPATVTVTTVNGLQVSIAESRAAMGKKRQPHTPASSHEKACVQVSSRRRGDFTVLVELLDAAEIDGLITALTTARNEAHRAGILRPASSLALVSC